MLIFVQPDLLSRLWLWLLFKKKNSYFLFFFSYLPHTFDLKTPDFQVITVVIAVGGKLGLDGSEEDENTEGDIKK